MVKATKPLCKRIAVVFDFDDTMAPDTVDSLAESCGLDSKAFRLERIQPLIEIGWDKIPARFYSFIQESKRRSDSKDKITKDYLARFGRQLAPFDGVPEMEHWLGLTRSEISPLEY
jgi:phosphoserine phosphatase